MNLTFASTRLTLATHPHKVEMVVTWHPCEGGRGWEGKAAVFKDGSGPIAEGHVIHVTQSCPLGRVFISLDPHAAGAWSFYDFEGTGISERDLQWATAWAAEGIRRKREAFRQERMW